MIYILRKHKSIFFLILLIALSFSAWYIFINKNINKVPEKADLVFYHNRIIRGIENDE